MPRSTPSARRPLPRIAALVHDAVLVRIVALLLAGHPHGWAQQPLAPDPLLPMQMQVLAVTPEQPKTEASFAVDSTTTRIYLHLTATAPGLRVTLSLPDGRTMDPENIGAAGGQYSYFHLEQDLQVSGISLWSQGHHYQYRMPAAGEGLYRVQVGAASLSEPVALIFEFSTDSTRIRPDAGVRTRFILDAPGMAAILGEPNRMVVTVQEGEAPVTGSVVSARIQQQQGPVATITLADNGEGADQQAGDGRYSGWFTPQLVGDFVATATIELPSRYQDPAPPGLPAGATGASGRLEFLHFPVVPAWGKLTGRIQELGIDEDGDKQFERIGFDVEVDVREPGRFGARVVLGKQGVPENLFRVGGGLATADLERGRRTIRVPIDVFELQKSAYDPPYEIRRVTLSYYSNRGAYDVSELHDLGETRTYAAAQFEKPKLAITGAMSDRAVDEDGDGAFDWLVVTVPVEVRTHPEHYSWHAELATAAGAKIEQVISSGHFGHSQNFVELKFDASRIRRMGANGPYVVRSLNVSGGGGSLHVATLGRTQSYAVTQFRAPNPRIVRVSERSVKPGEELIVGVDGADTNFQSTSRVSVAPGLDTDRLFVTEVTHLSFLLRVADNAAPGPHPLTITTNGETVTIKDAFTVEPAAAAEAAPPANPPETPSVSAANYARVTGAIRERTIDENGDGLLEAFALEVEIEANEPGIYSVVTQLEVQDGTREQRAGGVLVSEPGNYWITLEVPARNLYQFGPSFQFAIKEIELSVARDRGRLPVGKFADLGQTQRYELEQFELPMIATAGEPSEQGIDDDGDGLFDRLVVTIPIEKRRQARGNVNYSGVLLSPSRKRIESIGRVVPLEVGINRLTLEFDGVKIRETGMDGPFSVEEFRVSGYPDGVSIKNLIETRPYRSEQFQLSRPKLLSVTPPKARPGETVTVEVRGSTTNFSASESLVAAGESISARIDSVGGTELIRASFQVDPTAAPGPRTVTVTTGDETVTLPDGFRVVSPQETARLQLRQNPPKGKLTGEVRDHGVDEDGNGLFEKFVIEVDAELEKEGDYGVWLFFQRKDGSPESLGFHQQTGAGKQTISVPFPAHRLHARPDETPFTLTQIFLVVGDGKGLPPLDRLTRVWKTGEYSRAGFEPPRVVIPDKAKERAVDDDGDGLYDRLVVSVPVDVKKEIDPAGRYTWALALTDRAGKFVTMTEGAATLKVGLNHIEIEVDGAAIQESTGDGPYGLGLFRLKSADGSMLVDSVGTSQAYSASQFGSKPVAATR